MVVCAMVIAMDADRLFWVINCALAGAASAQATTARATRYDSADMSSSLVMEIRSCRLAEAQLYVISAALRRQLLARYWRTVCISERRRPGPAISASFAK